jgi:hypothetical protein
MCRPHLSLSRFHFGRTANSSFVISWNAFWNSSGDKYFSWLCLSIPGTRFWRRSTSEMYVPYSQSVLELSPAAAVGVPHCCCWETVPAVCLGKIFFVFCNSPPLLIQSGGRHMWFLSHNCGDLLAVDDWKIRSIIDIADSTSSWCALICSEKSHCRFRIWCDDVWLTWLSSRSPARPELSLAGNAGLHLWKIVQLLAKSVLLCRIQLS